MATTNPKRVMMPVDRKEMRVSSRSFWTDDIWYLDNPKPGQKNVVYWKYLLPDGSWTTDPENFEILESFREAFWGMLSDAGWYGTTLAVGGMENIASGARSLFRWMNYRGLRSVGDLAPENQNLYLEDIPGIVVYGNDFYGERLRDAEFESDDFEVEEDDETADVDATQSVEREYEETLSNEDEGEDEVEESERDELTWSKVTARIKPIYFLFAQKAKLAARGFGFIQNEPFGGRRLNKVTGTVAKHTLNRIPPLPDEVVGPLLRIAIEWLEVRSADILAMQDLLLNARAEREDEGNSLTQKAGRVRAALESYQFSDGSNICEPWGMKNVGGLRQRPPAIILRYCFNRLRDACVIVLQYLIGIRPSEVCGIAGGMDETTGLPTCVGTIRLRSGFMEAFNLTSTLSKGVERPRLEEWLLACRPAGSTHLPLTVLALQVLERLMSPWRKLGGYESMIVGLTLAHSFPHSPANIEPVSVKFLGKHLKIFITREVDFSGLPDKSHRGESLVEYRKSGGRNISARHARKTFAAYILETRASLLGAVKDHFKHMSVSTTEGAYFPQSTRMRGDINSVGTLDSVSMFMQAVRGRKFVGRMAEAVHRYFSGPEFQGNLDDNDLFKKIKALVIKHDLRIFFNDHGKCFIKVDPLASRCRQATDTAHIMMTKPDYTVRSPSMCGGCAVFAMDAENLPFWKDRSIRYASDAEAARKDDREHEYRVHLARAQQAEQFVKLLMDLEDDR
jgi:integrase